MPNSDPDEVLRVVRSISSHIKDTGHQVKECLKILDGVCFHCPQCNTSDTNWVLPFRVIKGGGVDTEHLLKPQGREYLLKVLYEVGLRAYRSRIPDRFHRDPLGDESP